MPNLSGTTQFFTKSAENTVAMTLGGSVTGGVTTTVPVTNMSNYTDGDVVAFVVDPGTPSLKQVFTGTKSGTNIINAVWTEGTNQPHTLGAPVIDYTTATHWDLLLQGLLASHTLNGTLKAGIVSSAAIATGAVGTTQIADAAITGSKLTSYKVQSQEDTTNTTQTAATIQCGWGQILGTGSTGIISETLIFPVPVTKVLSLVVTLIGYKSGGAIAAAITEFNTNLDSPISVDAYNITTTGATIKISDNAGTLGSAYHGYSWTMIGI